MWSIWVVVLSFTWLCVKYLDCCAFCHVPIREVSGLLCFLSRAYTWSIWVVVLSVTCLYVKYLDCCAFCHVPIREVSGWLCFLSRACAWSFCMIVPYRIGSRIRTHRIHRQTSVCCILSSGLFPGVWILYANVSEHSVCSIFIGEYEDGTDRAFRNVGI